MTATILHGDCLELMRTLPDRSIDLFLCDLPYGCLSAKRGGMRVGVCPPDNPNGNIVVVNKPCAWDVPIDLEQFWVQVERLMKDDHTPIIHFCNTRFGVDLINSNPKWFRYDLIWNKSNGVGFLSANKMPMRSHENIYVFAKKGARYTRVDCEGCVKSVIDVANKKGKGKHPTQKPDDLYRWLIERYSKEGDTILDPTAGSFASVFTAVSMGRDGIGMEMNDAFYNKANERASVLRGSPADIQIPTTQ